MALVDDFVLEAHAAKRLIADAFPEERWPFFTRNVAKTGLKHPKTHLKPLSKPFFFHFFLVFKAPKSSGEAPYALEGETERLRT